MIVGLIGIKESQDKDKFRRTKKQLLVYLLFQDVLLVARPVEAQDFVFNKGGCFSGNS